MSDVEETSDFQRKVMNTEDNVFNLHEDMSAPEENSASQQPSPTSVRVKPMRKPKPSNPPSSPIPSPVNREALSPGEMILDVEVSPGQTIPEGQGSYHMGDAREPSLNSHPASMGMPTTRTGFYNTTTGITHVVCPMCFQKFTTTTVFENGHLDPGGPCEKFRMKLEASQNTPKEGKGRVKGTNKDIDEAHHSVQPGAEDYEMDCRDYPMEGGIDQQGFYSGMAHLIAEEAHLFQGGDGNQRLSREETYLGPAMGDFFEGLENVDSVRNFLSPDLGDETILVGEPDRPFELPTENRGELPGMGQFWGYQGFEGLEGFEGNWQYFGPENGSGFPGFGMSGS